MINERINILLPTYNGIRYLPKLLDSLLAQTCPELITSIRDDGSTDETYTFLCAWASGRAGVLLSRGERLGAAGGFLHLLQTSCPSCQYFAFCDQDDIWLPDKIERAIAALQACGPDEPAMYCSRIEYVDEQLRHLGYSRIPKRVEFSNALVQNMAAGCTIVLNRRARDLICERLPRKVLWHDWWCYLVVCAFGKVTYDEKPSIRYRLHANNHTGAQTSFLASVKSRIARFSAEQKGSRCFSNQALEFHRCFGDRLSAPYKRTLERFLSVRGSLRDRISYNVAMEVWRQTWLDTALLRALILIGRV